MITYQIQNSKAVQAIAYDEIKQTLFIKFTDSPLYAYADVSQEMVLAFVKAPSKGSFFQKHIKNNYQTARLDN